MVTFKEFFSFKNNRFFWLNLIAMVVVIVAAPLGTLQWLDNYTRHGEAVVVPDVKGMNLRIAENELDKQSLKSNRHRLQLCKRNSPRCYFGTESRRWLQGEVGQNRLSDRQCRQRPQGSHSRYHG